MVLTLYVTDASSFPGRDHGRNHRHVFVRPRRLHRARWYAAGFARAVLVLGMPASAVTMTAAPALLRRQHAVQREVMANLFEWNWTRSPTSARRCSARRGTAACRCPAAGLGQAAAARRRQRHRPAPVVGGVPAGRLPLTSRMGDESQFQSMVRDVPLGRREGVRRRGDQPHDRPGRHVLRRRAPTSTTATRASTTPNDFHQYSRRLHLGLRRHRRLQQPAPGPQLRAVGLADLRHRHDEGA